MKFSFENKIAIGFGITLIILTVLGYQSYLNNQNYIETSRSVTHANDVLYHTEKVLTLSLEIETGQRGFVLTGEEEYLAPYKRAVKAIDQHLFRLRELTKDHSEQRVRTDTLQNLIEKRRSRAEKLIALQRAHGPDSTLRVIKSNPGQLLQEQIRELINTMQKTESDLLLSRTSRSNVYIRNFNFTFFGLFGCIAIVITVVAFTIRHNILKLRKASDQIYDLYNNAPCGYHSVDQDGVFVEINQTELEWIGYQRDEVLHKLTFRDLLTAESKKTLDINFPVYKKNGKINNAEFELTCKDGRTIPVILNSTAVINEQGKFVKSRSTMFDNSEQKIADTKIKELNGDREKNLHKLETVNAELESFTYSVSHDLRAPLRAIAGYSQILEEDYESKLDEEGKKVLQTIRRNAHRMGALIDDLLAFSHFGKTELSKSKIKMKALVESLITEIMTEEYQRDVRFTVNELGLTVADLNLIKHVWLNLLSNAIKYSRPKEIALIEIGSLTSEMEHVYYIKDNGDGFNMQYVSKLFKVFQRLHKIKEFEGTGVGLAIVQRIIHRHGGKVWAEGEPDKGATFYFSLPKIN